MNQQTNIIRVMEGNVSSPYIVLERINASVLPVVREGLKVIKETRNGAEAFLICEPIKDAEWSDIETDELKKGHTKSKT